VRAFSFALLAALKLSHGAGIWQRVWMQLEGMGVRDS
jgi:hypothetical protein